MAIVEILVKVGDGNGFLDGMPVVIRGPGFLFSTAEVAAWWTSATEPPGLASLKLGKQEEVRRVLKVLKYLTDAAHTVEIATNRRYGELPPSPTIQQQYTRLTKEAEVWLEIERAKLSKQTFAAEGFDTNWGPGDLRGSLAVVADLTPEEAQELLAPPDDTTILEYEVRHNLRMRRWRIAFETFLTAPQLAIVRDANQRWDVKRATTPLTYAQCQGTIT